MYNVPAQAVSAAGDLAYIALHNFGMQIVNFSNPISPTVVGYYDTPGTSLEVVAAGRYAYDADLHAGLVILRLATWLAPPDKAVITAAGGTLVATDGTRYTFSRSTFSDTVRITHQAKNPASIPSTGDLIGIEHSFEVTAVYSNTDQSAQPTKPYTLTVQYTDQEKGPAIEDTLALYYWDGSQWMKEPSSVVDLASNTVTATPNHFSVWAVLGETHRMYLPLVRKS